MSMYYGARKNGGVSWRYYDKYDAVDNKYLPARGEGENMATQMVTAIAKLVYKWYNDGDVYDNTAYMEGWANDLSSYANWLDDNTDASDILGRIYECRTDEEYENLLKDMTDLLEGDEELLEAMAQKEKRGSIYDYDGRFRFVERYDDDEEDDYDDDEDYE